MSDPNKAIFLSYASQDAEAVQRIAEALRAAGVEVWFDQSELRGGDAWDQKIRRQIKDCVLFVPIISASTQARAEGYFRREWKLAVDRTHDMADHVPFLVPVVIDDTSDAVAFVPDKFRDVQWTRLRVGGANGAFCERIQGLLLGEAGPRPPPAAAESMRARATAIPTKRRWVAPAIVGCLLIAVLAIWWTQKFSAPAPAPRAVVTVVEPPPKPISEARKLAQQARALIDDDPLAVRENYLAAERICQRAIALDPAESEAWAVATRASVMLAAYYQDRSAERKQQARSRAETALRLAPESVESGLAFASYDYWLGAGVSAARIRLEALAERLPADRRVLERLAQLEFRAAKRIEPGERWQARAAALGGGSAFALAERAHHHWVYAELPQTQHWADQSLAVQPTTAGYHEKLILLTWAWGDVNAARALIATLPGSLRQEDNIALFAYTAEIWSRNFAAAAAVVERIPREFLEGYSLFYPKGYLMGEALELSGKVRAAEIHRRGALKQVEARLALEPNRAQLLLWKGKLLARLGELVEAAHCFEAAEELGIPEQRWSFAYKPEKFVLLGRNDNAIAACVELLTRRTGRWPHVLNDFRFEPIFDPLRNDARFKQLIAEGEGWLAEQKASTTQGANSKPQTQNSQPAGLVHAKSAPADKFIAVLPFANLSPDPENAFFADGVHEDVITNLAKIRDLKVISRTSTLAYRDPAQRNLRKIAEELGVAAVLEGSVRRAGNKVRVTAQLIDARTDQHLWAETYDKELSDIFAVQAALAQEIAGALKVRLTPGEQASLAQAITTSAEAYDLYLQAELRRQTLKPMGSTRAEWEQVVELYERALRLDPAFTMAFVRLATVHGMMFRFANLDPSATRLVLAREATEAAERIAPGSAEASYARGLFAYFIENNWERALVALQRAESGLPNDARLMFTIALAYERLGRWQEEKAYFERAFILDPKNLDSVGMFAVTLFTGRQYSACLEIARRHGVEYWVLRAQFALDGNLPALRQSLAARLRDHETDAARFHAYAAALDARDFAAAFRAIADAEADRMLKGMGNDLLLASVPGRAVPALTRAQVSWLRGDASAARQFALEAVPLCETKLATTPRGMSGAFRGVALAEALAGRVSAALGAIEQAIASTNEAVDRDLARECLGKINVILGRREEALAALREMMTGRCEISPNEIRADPVWSRLKDDPRFEQILKSAKPL